MPAFLLPLIASGVGSALSYFEAQARKDAENAAAEKARRELDKAKVSTTELESGLSDIERAYGGVLTDTLNDFSFVTRGVQSAAAKGNIVGKLAGQLAGDLADYRNEVLMYNKNIQAKKAGIADSTISPGSEAASGAVAGLQTGMLLSDIVGDPFAGSPDAPGIDIETPGDIPLEEGSLYEAQQVNDLSSISIDPANRKIDNIINSTILNKDNVVNETAVAPVQSTMNAPAERNEQSPVVEEDALGLSGGGGGTAVTRVPIMQESGFFAPDATRVGSQELSNLTQDEVLNSILRLPTDVTKTKSASFGDLFGNYKSRTPFGL